MLSYGTAYALRFDFDFDAFRAWQLTVTVPFLVAIRLAVFWRSGMFRLTWRHVGFRDLFGLQAAVTLSSLLFVVALFFVGLLAEMPRSVLIIDYVLTIFFCGGVMFAQCAPPSRVSWMRPSSVPTQISLALAPSPTEKIVS